MSYELRLEELKSVHAALEEQLIEALANHATNVEISEIKKRKLHAKDMIEQLAMQAKKEQYGITGSMWNPSTT